MLQQSLRCPASYQYLFLHAVFKSHAFIPPSFPKPIQAYSYSAVPQLSEGNILLTSEEEILILFSLQKDWNTLLRKVLQGKLSETVKTRYFSRTRGEYTVENSP